MATELKFTTKDGKKEYCEITPSDIVTVQVEREAKGYFTVYANVEGMSPVSIFSDSGMRKDYIFQVDVPEGVVVTMESVTHVTSAKVQN